MNLRLLAVLSATLALCSASEAGCQGGCCGGACARPAPLPAAPVAAWRDIDARWVGWYAGDQLLGVYSHRTGKYYTSLPGDGWTPGVQLGEPECIEGCDCSKCDDGCDCGQRGRACSDACRCVAPAKAVVKAEAKPAAAVDLLKDPGVTPGKIKAAGEEYRLNGQPISAGRAKRLLSTEAGRGDDAIPDDARLIRLTVIGSEPERQQVLADLEALRLRDGLCVQSYPPEHWAVARAGFVTTGHPTIYLQAPDGKVLHRQDAYRGGEALAEAVRKARDGYDGKQDPDLTQPLAGLADLSLGHVALGGAALLGVLALFRRPQ